MSLVAGSSAEVLARAWVTNLKSLCSLVVHKNAPYRGVSDGLPTALRRMTTGIALSGAAWLVINRHLGGDSLHAWLAGLGWRAGPDLFFFASWGRGFETPTFLEVANVVGASGMNLGLDASTSRHAEVGAKAIVPGWMRLSVRSAPEP